MDHSETTQGTCDGVSETDTDELSEDTENGTLWNLHRSDPRSSDDAQSTSSSNDSDISADQVGPIFILY